MDNDSFLKRLRNTSGMLGSWCTFASFASTEIMANLGFDFLVLDMQHCELTQSQFPALLGAFHGAKPTPIVRAPKNDYHVINWLFDLGAPAVLVPMVNSAEGARAAVEAAKYPPLGKRSFGPYRCAAYGREVGNYMRRSDELSTLIIQIESEEGARQIDGILAVPGIDAVFMGPNDLAFSMLGPGQSFFGGDKPSDDDAGDSQWTGFARTPEVIGLCQEVMRKCKAASLPFGLTAVSVPDAYEWLDQGASFMTLGGDFLFLRSGASNLSRPSKP